MTDPSRTSAAAYLQSLELFGIKLGLDQIRGLLAALDHPERAFPSIIVAGTNGKGSVTAMMERALRAAGHRTGRYTSPHLVRLEERIAIDGEPIGADTLEALTARTQSAAASLPAPPSFFEATTAMALDAFRDARVDLAVLEVGLGGRLDATNAVDEIAAVITAIDFDHEQYLGTTIEAIAGEKAGIIKPGCFAVLGRNPPIVRQVVEAASAAAHAPCVYALDGVAVDATMSEGRAIVTIATPRSRYEAVTLGLRGRHQVENAVTAVRALEEIAARTPHRVPAAAIVAGLARVVWPARLELRTWRGRPILIDGAHNPAGARALASYVHETYGSARPVVVGAMRDKNIRGMLDALLPIAAPLICAAPNTPRAFPPAELAALARAAARDLPDPPAIIEAASPADALDRAIAAGAPAIVAGSLYLAGEVRDLSC
jgi:dihydrofolate synthase/folylpolyglutamate synthase